MENNNVKIHLLQLRYLIMFATIDSFYCGEIEMASGFSEKEFLESCSIFYESQSIKEEINIDNILNYIDSKYIIFANSCITHAESSFGIFSYKGNTQPDIEKKYEESILFLGEVIEKNNIDYFSI